jgi:RimJ/RimL family protein N-acetyltransferase
MNKFSFLARKILWNVREHGFVGLLIKLSVTVRQEIFQGSEYVLLYDYGRTSEKEFRFPDSITFDSAHKKDDLSREDLESLRRFVAKPHMRKEDVDYYLENVLKLFQHGGVLWIAKKRGVLATFLWSYNKNSNYTPHFYFFPLCTDDAVIVAAYTLHEWRGQGMVPALFRYATKQLKKEGIKRIFASCKVWNKPSYRTCLKVGFLYIGTARKLDILGRRIIIWGKGGSNE